MFMDIMNIKESGCMLDLMVAEWEKKLNVKGKGHEIQQIPILL